MITSKDNQQIKDLKKLQEKRFRMRRKQFVAEGEDLIAAALAAGWVPDRIFHAPDAPEWIAEQPSAWAVEYGVLAEASGLGSGSRAIAVFDEAESGDVEIGQLALYVEGVSDPGNVGTLIRSAAAFSDSPVLLGPGCAEPWSPKALRAGMGATFANPPVIEATLSYPGVTIVALDGSGDIEIADVDVEGPVVICAGAEREGLAPETLERADLVACIPMLETGPESLNVAMAATVALYQLAGITNSTEKQA
ncbi:MAG: RNA methyltransferase [Thermoleophilaceae bacterium]|nr:RNA methyltransferase [Thermoleophilaceae bacterium]